MGTNGKSLERTMDWDSNPRWAGITRPYTVEEVDRLRGSIRIEYTLAQQGAERLWNVAAQRRITSRRWER